MFDFLILLTGAAEQPIFLDLLSEHNPLLTVIPIFTLSGFFDLDPDVLARARLIAFATPVIVPRQILGQLGFGAYNFHPGPPEYPGWAPAHFALYEGAQHFGVTAHGMVEKVDAGPIVAVDRFAIPPDTEVTRLEGLAYAHLARMFWSMSKALTTQPQSFAALPVAWSPRKNTRKTYRALCDIPADITRDDLHRRLRYSATTISAWPPSSSCTASNSAPRARSRRCPCRGSSFLFQTIPVIASRAKQSRVVSVALDCFALLAMTENAVGDRAPKVRISQIPHGNYFQPDALAVRTACLRIYLHRPASSAP